VHFVAKLLEVAPDHQAGRKKDFDRWDLDFDRLLRLDHRSEADVHAMIDWAVPHSFWGGVVQSPASLRDQWDKLAAQRRRDLPPRPGPAAPFVSVDDRIAANPSDRRVRGPGGALVDPEADVDHLAEFRKARALHLGSRRRRAASPAS
jgi:hypothetical protein